MQIDLKSKRTQILRIAVGLFLLLTVPRPALALEKDAFFFLLDGEFLGGYSQVESEDGIGSTVDSWSISPNLKIIKDVLYWINLYSGTFNRTSQVVNQEEGGRRTETTQSHSLTTALKFNPNEDWSIRPLFFSDWVFVNETNDESFGEGLYDYQDVGGGVELTKNSLATTTQLDQWRFGFRYFDRQYPNYRSLIGQFDPRSQVQEDREKDFAGYKLNLGFESATEKDWSWGLEGIVLYKDFYDKRTIDSNGIRSANDTRQDFLNYINAYVSHPVNPNWSLRLDGQVSVNISDLDFYDTKNTASLTDDDFIKNYFDYYSFTLRPTILYQKEIGKDRILGFSASYDFTALTYPDRKTQNTAGAYLSDTEEDYTHTFSARFSYPINKYISWVSTASYTFAESNQDYEAFYLYSYDLWSVLSGVSIKY